MLIQKNMLYKNLGGEKVPDQMDHKRKWVSLMKPQDKGKRHEII